MFIHWRIANVIEFGGQRALFNSCVENPEPDVSGIKQRAAWAARYPRATVTAERMTRDECRALNFNGISPYDVGRASEEG